MEGAYIWRAFWGYTTQRICACSGVKKNSLLGCICTFTYIMNMTMLNFQYSLRGSARPLTSCVHVRPLLLVYIATSIHTPLHSTSKQTSSGNVTCSLCTRMQLEPALGYLHEEAQSCHGQFKLKFNIFASYIQLFCRNFYLQDLIHTVYAK